MNTRQRTGLWIVLMALIMAVMFTGLPDLIKETWSFVNTVVLAMGTVGGLLFGLE